MILCWIGAAIGGALGLGGSIFGGISASKAMKKIKKDVQQQRAENLAHYNRRYNEDATQRADAQRILTNTQEAIRSRNRAAAGARAVMGGSEESAAAARMANNQALADATSQIAARADARKDAIEAQYLQNDATSRHQLNQLKAGKAAATTQAIQGLWNTGASVATALESDNTKARRAKANSPGDTSTTTGILSTATYNPDDIQDDIQYA